MAKFAAPSFRGPPTTDIKTKNTNLPSSQGPDRCQMQKKRAPGIEAVCGRARRSWRAAATRSSAPVGKRKVKV